MTSRVPRISGHECVRAPARVGFYIRRQHGSHIIIRRDDPFAQLVVPDTGNWIQVRSAPSSDKLN